MYKKLSITSAHGVKKKDLCQKKALQFRLLESQNDRRERTDFYSDVVSHCCCYPILKDKNRYCIAFPLWMSYVRLSGGKYAGRKKKDSPICKTV